MIIVVSPTKRMRYVAAEVETTKPLFVSKTKKIMNVLKDLSVEELMQAYKVKENIAQQNYDRYQSFSYDTKGTPALLSYQGLQYQYMNLDMNEKDWDYVDSHMRILDALYGVLLPNTSVYPYRLDMMTKLKVNEHSLYEFWTDTIYKQLMSDLKDHKEKKIICLASKEYAQMIVPFAGDDVIMVDFYVVKQGEYKMEATAAKMARGRMMGYLLNKKIDTVEGIKSFKEDGFLFDEQLSDERKLVFYKVIS